MKYCYLLIAFLALSISHAQEDDFVHYAALDVKPDYPGGIGEFYMHINKNFRTPEVEYDVTLRITVSFIIDIDGSLTDVKALKDPGYGAGAEAVRVIKICPKKWIPGQIKGKPVRAQYLLPITLKVTGSAKETPADSLAAPADDGGLKPKH